MTLFYIQQYGNLFEVRLQTDAPLNAWQGRVIVPSDVSVQSVSYGESIGDVWQTPPTLTGNHIDFVGGITTGFAGDGVLFRFTAAPRPVSSPELIAFDAGRTMTYAADGNGSEMPVTLQPITINGKDILTTATTTGVIADDMTPPESFTIKSVQDPAIFDGHPAIIFSTTDNAAGIDHYEVKEYTDNGMFGWHTATSPYLINPDTSSILVRAIDRAGNARTERFDVQRPWLQRGGGVLVIGLIVAAAVIGFFIIKWRKKSVH